MKLTVMFSRYIIILFVTVTSFFDVYSQSEVIAPAAWPERIMLTIPGNPATTAAVSWRTQYADSVPLAEICESTAIPYPEITGQVRKVPGWHSPWERGSKSAMGNKVIFTGLKPSTRYIYRVGNGKIWSEWFEFRTASDKAEKFSFLYFGDMQNDISSQVSRVFRSSVLHFPESRFILYAGDIVDRSYDERWNQFFKAGNWILSSIPSMPTPGNHEYYPVPGTDTREFSKHWQQIFTMPDNGPSKEFKSRSYYTDYQGVRFISLDSPAMGYDEGAAVLVLDWLEKVLLENPNKWTVLFTHYPIYSCSQGRDNDGYREALQPLLEKYGVDLVLAGHDHTYCRGRNMAMAGADAKNYPVYVVSVSGPKMYGPNSTLWAEKVASETQLYQHITIGGNKLLYTAWTLDGKLYDSFTLKKTGSGINSYSENRETRKLPERLSIPKGRLEGYTPEEIKKIEKRAAGKK
jgi:hypothetical protein